ncbi:MAG: putative molibdopterin-dependent oxidoreductase YjgC [Sulfurimonas sp.]|jgi:predicted molibdopterin-dependent oxidoreductase YjgC|uniref:hypothetical protein n=1 Tax=Sulfurimonas sp. TaxID=2022749 RepID=UPI0039E46636
MLLFPFLYTDDVFNQRNLKKYTNNFEEFYELTQTLSVKDTLAELDVAFNEIKDFIELVKDKKVAIICGLGIQKYRDGADVMRAIDALAVGLDLFTKEGSGVAYLGNSKEGITSPFNTNANRVSKVDTEFSNYKKLFFQNMIYELHTHTMQ